MRKIIVKYKFTTVSKDISGIIAKLSMPMMHSPPSSLAMRLDGQIASVCALPWGKTTYNTKLRITTAMYTQSMPAELNM
jgi:hypothetical protein